MRRREQIKDHVREAEDFSARALLLFFFVLVGLGILVSRLVYLQLVSHEHFTTLSDKNRLRVMPESPLRGRIFDRNGQLLAENIPSHSVSITPDQVKDMDAALAGLGQLVSITAGDLDRFKRLRGQTPHFMPVPVRLNLSDEEMGRVAVNLHRLPGVELGAQMLRYYPLGELGVHAIGYVGRISQKDFENDETGNYSPTDFIGKSGVESYYEQVLRGKVGYRQVETNARGVPLREVERVPPVPGQDLYLNLDMHLQAVAESVLGAERGAVVAIDPRNGAVLAMASMPGYDPNWFVTGIDSQRYTELRDSPDQPLFNRVLRGRYPPGSTIKPFVGLAGLEYGLRTASSKILCPGWYSLPRNSHRYRDWRHTGHGTVDLERALVNSCDVYFYDLAKDMGVDRMHDYLVHFGFGIETGLDTRGELPGLFPSTHWKRKALKKSWYLGESLIAGIGQGYDLSTPLQLAVATATLSTRGKRMAPRLLAAREDRVSGRRTAEPVQLLEKVRAVNPANWDSVIRGMVGVVQYGTASKANIGLRYSMAGKTGTAQMFGIKQNERYNEELIAKRLRDHAWFIGFAPVESPQIAVAVIIENGGSGGTVAAPAARTVMDAYLDRGAK